MSMAPRVVEAVERSARNKADKEMPVYWTVPICLPAMCPPRCGRRFDPIGRALRGSTCPRGFSSLACPSRAGVRPEPACCLLRQSTGRAARRRRASPIALAMAKSGATTDWGKPLKPIEDCAHHLLCGRFRIARLFGSNVRRPRWKIG